MKRKCIVFITGIFLTVSGFCQHKQDVAKSICDRTCLENFAKSYIDAVIAHDPTKTMLDKNIKYTENGQRLVPGDGIWNTASGWGNYKLYISDTEEGQVGFIGTIKESQLTSILALRLKIEKMKITEAEAFVARSDSEAVKLDKMFPPNQVFLESIPQDERLSRDSLKKVANMYFTALERNDGKGIYPFTDNCNRLENGHFTTNNPKKDNRPFDVDAMGCKEQFETGFFCFVTRIRDRRFPVVDVERGLVFSFGFFDHAGNVPLIKLTNGMSFPAGVKQPFTWEIAELFKIEKGLLREIQAVYQEAPYGMGSGWSSWEQSISSEPNY